MKWFLRNVTVIAFVAGLASLGILYGTVAGIKQWFPTLLLKDAKTGADALYFLWKNGNVPVGFLQYLDAAPDPSIHSRSNQENSRTDWILITGDPYEFLEECPNFGCLAWVVDRTGRVIHSWETDLNELWRHTAGQIDPRRFHYHEAELIEGGGLLVSFYTNDKILRGAGLPRFDRSGRLVWFNEDPIHHWLSIDERGRIYAPTMHALPTPHKIAGTSLLIDCPRGTAELDSIAVIDPDGKIEARFALLDIMAAQGFAALVTMTNDHCDPLHLNDVRYIDAKTAQQLNFAS